VANGGSNDVSAYTITTGTGALTPVTNSPFAAGTNPSAVTVSPNGNFLYVANGGDNNVSAFTIDGATGALTSPATIAAGTSPSGVSIDPNGLFLYVTNSGSNNVSAYTITTGTGALTPISGALGNPFSAGTTPLGIATPGRP